MKRNILIALAFSMLLIIGAGAAVVFVITSPQMKVISGMSYYDKPLIVQVADQTIQVEPYQNFDIQITTSSPQLMSVTDFDGNQIFEKSFDFDSRAAIAVEVISPADKQEETSFCFAKADVTSMYYLQQGQTYSESYIGEAKDVDVLVDQPSSSMFEKLDLMQAIRPDRTVYPSKFIGDHLPEEIDPDNTIVGYIPFVCEDQQDPAKIAEQMYVWRYFEVGDFGPEELLEE